MSLQGEVGKPNHGHAGGRGTGEATGAGRHRARVRLTTFQVALILAIVVLAALVFNILNQTFGLIAVENAIDPAQLVRSYTEEQMAAMPGTTMSEDDESLANAIAADPNAIGFFGYAYYQRHADELRPLAVDGVTPSAATVNDGTYEFPAGRSSSMCRKVCRPTGPRWRFSTSI
ncbi:MAG: hypothetical protein R2851_02130 [Caldilineaceae bacterium]